MRINKIYKSLKTNWIIIVALCSFAYLVFVAFGGGSSSDETKVWVLAKHSVEQKLKSPDSAKFPNKSKATISEVNGKYIIKSYVDANNSFGGSVRSKFTVTLIKSATGDYITESVNIE